MSFRIAVVGAHETGKTTLASGLQRVLSGVTLIEEPYRAMETEGHAFADPPTVRDFEEQLQRSLTDAGVARPPAVFDRCAVDLFAYLLALRTSRTDSVTLWFDETRTAATAFDLLVLVPIERPDRITPTSAPRLRRHVDRLLRAGLIEDEWALGVPVLEVVGSPDTRVAQVVARLAQLTTSGTSPAVP